MNESHARALKAKLTVHQSETEYGGYKFTVYSTQAIEESFAFSARIELKPAQVYLVINQNENSPIKGFMLTIRPIKGQLDTKIDVLFASNDAGRERLNRVPVEVILATGNSLIYNTSKELLAAAGIQYNGGLEVARLQYFVEHHRTRPTEIGLVEQYLSPMKEIAAEYIFFDNDKSPELPALRGLIGDIWEKLLQPQNLKYTESTSAVQLT